MSWLLDLIKNISEGFSYIVDALILLERQLFEASQSLTVESLGVVNDTTVIFKCIDAFRYVVGDYLFHIMITFILISISWAIYQFTLQLKNMIFGDKGALEGTGIFRWIAKIFKK